MGKRRGPAPDPREVRVISGNASRRPMPPKLEGAQPSRPDPPKTLHGRRARAHFRRLVEILHKRRLMTDLDVDQLALYCTAYQEHLEYSEQIRQHGAVIRSPNGYPVQSPYIALRNRAHEQMRSLAQEFGMTPAARTRVSPIGGPKRKSALQELAERARQSKRKD